MLLKTRISQFDYIFLSVLAVDSGWAGEGVFRVGGKCTSRRCVYQRLVIRSYSEH